MPHLSYELETVTPLLLGGANPRDKPELRAAPFRGVLRYWLRALLANPPDLLRQEANLLGNTDLGSPVTLRVHIDRTTCFFPGRKRGYRSAPDYSLRMRFGMRAPLGC